jgi:hypothetical protein
MGSPVRYGRLDASWYRMVATWSSYGPIREKGMTEPGQAEPAAHYTEPRPNLIQSDAGFSVEVLGRTGLRYVEHGKTAIVDSEVLAKPGAIAVYRDSLKRWEPQTMSRSLPIVSVSESWRTSSERSALWGTRPRSWLTGHGPPTEQPVLGPGPSLRQAPLNPRPGMTSTSTTARSFPGNRAGVHHPDRVAHRTAQSRPVLPAHLRRQQDQDHQGPPVPAHGPIAVQKGLLDQPQQ